MVVKVFILGRPGSGKSAAARYIAALAQNYGWLPIHISDYGILYDMFLAERALQFTPKQKKFLPTEHDGFDVLKFEVLDDALREVELQIYKYMSDVRNLLLIEFARNDYRKALKHISQDLLQDAYFLFINSDMASCLQRINKRVAYPTTPDDHFVSTKIFKRYYRKDNSTYMKSNLKRDFEIDENRIKIIDNTSTLKDFHIKMWELAETILEQESYILRETEPMPALPSLMSEAAQSKVAMSEQVSDAGNI